MPQAYFRFFAELNDFLPPAHRGRLLVHHFVTSGSVKDAIESMGIPHTEIDLITLQGDSIGFDYLVQDHDRISVYPAFRSLDVSRASRVRPSPLPQTRFILDTHLGRLAAYLRMLGFDTLYRNDFGDEELARVAHHEQRVLLTRDVGLLKRSNVTHGYCLRGTAVRRQTVEVVQRFNLLAALIPFRRCLRCNTLLEPVAKQRIRDRLPPKTAQLYDEFHQCPRCGRVYWKGSHFDSMRQFIEQCLDAGSAARHRA